ncbi:hypothetical protein Q5752_003514 [Cryptotrichosporon argae]
MADVKGKGKVVEPVAVESDDDEDYMAMFTSNRTMLVRPGKPAPHKPRAPSPPSSSAVVEILDDEPDSDEERIRRRKKKEKKSELPAWTKEKVDDRRKRGSTEEPWKRGSTEEDRRRGKRPSNEERTRYTVDKGAIVIDSSDEETPAKSGRAATPPPTMTEEERAAYVAEYMRKLEQDAAATVEVAIPSPAKDLGPATVYNIVMVADPKKKRVASERAVQAYERPKQITIGRDAPLSKVIEALAKRLEKGAGEIVLVHNKRRIYDTSQTGRALGVGSTVDLQGFEKAYYDHYQRAERERRMRQLDGAHSEDEAGGSQPDTSGAHAVAADAGDGKDGDEEDDAVGICVRGERGEADLHVRWTETAHTVCRIYLRKLGEDPKLAVNMRLVFEGDDVDPTTTLAGMDVEDGEQLDVRDV